MKDVISIDKTQFYVITTTCAQLPPLHDLGNNTSASTFLLAATLYPLLPLSLYNNSLMIRSIYRGHALCRSRTWRCTPTTGTGTGGELQGPIDGVAGNR